MSSTKISRPLRQSPLRQAAYALLALFFLLRFDLWQVDETSFVFGLPAGLTFHVLYCLAAVGVLGVTVRLAWPDHLAEEVLDENESPATDETPRR